MKNDSFKSLNVEKRQQVYEQNMANHPHSIALIIEPHLKSKLGTNQSFKYLFCDQD
jgi:hypothetical protein